MNCDIESVCGYQTFKNMYMGVYKCHTYVPTVKRDGDSSRLIQWKLCVACTIVISDFTIGAVF